MIDGPRTPRDDLAERLQRVIDALIERVEDLEDKVATLTREHDTVPIDEAFAGMDEDE